MGCWLELLEEMPQENKTQEKNKTLIGLFFYEPYIILTWFDLRTQVPLLPRNECTDLSFKLETLCIGVSIKTTRKAVTLVKCMGLGTGFP